MDDLNGRGLIVHHDLYGGLTGTPIPVNGGELERIQAVQRGDIPLLQKTIVHAVRVVAANLGPLCGIQSLAERKSIAVKVVESCVSYYGNNASNS